MTKKIISIATLVAVLFTTQISATVRTTSFSDGTNVNFSTTDKTLKISVKNINAESVAIYLEDTEGFSLVSETVKVTPNFVKAYRLENLPNGTYHFTVKRNGSKVVQYFDITPLGITLSEKEREETLLPSLTQKGDRTFYNLKNGTLELGSSYPILLDSGEIVEFPFGVPVQNNDGSKPFSAGDVTVTYQRTAASPEERGRAANDAQEPRAGCGGSPDADRPERRLQRLDFDRRFRVSRNPLRRSRHEARRLLRPRPAFPDKRLPAVLPAHGRSSQESGR